MTTVPTILQICRSKHWKIGLTNGCFDNLHEGHKYLLTEARKHCDILFAAINDDKSVKKLKGKGRPFRKLDVRMEALMGTELVAMVFPFHTEQDLHDLVVDISPDILVKGEDYIGINVTGGEYVRSNGGRVILIPIKRGYSTTRLNS